MLDLVQLLPHCKKDVKLDTKARGASAAGGARAGFCLIVR